jgi:branched-chain amino acid transport system ATP-binding protein
LQTILQTEHLRKSFGSIEAIRDVSIHVGEGEILGIIGPNGAGKTTLFNLLMGNYTQDGGRIYFMGKNIDQLRTFQRVNLGMARTFQFARTFRSINVLEHIRIARLAGANRGSPLNETEHESEAERVAEIAGLPEMLRKTPGELNIEELRKLELAMSMALKPVLLMIDEMFAGLTHEESNEIIGIIRKMMNEGFPTTVMVIDHNLAALSNVADRVVAIDLGMMIAEGTFDAVCENEKVRKAYLGEYMR